MMSLVLLHDSYKVKQNIKFFVNFLFTFKIEALQMSTW